MDLHTQNASQFSGRFSYGGGAAPTAGLSMRALPERPVPPVGREPPPDIAQDGHSERRARNPVRDSVLDRVRRPHRFESDGVASTLLFRDRGRDAADCRQLYDEGRVRLFGVDLRSGAIDFGDDASTRAQDGQCDDPPLRG